MVYLFSFFLSVLFLLSGCALPRDSVDNVQLLRVMGYDQMDDQVKGTAIYSVFTPDKKESAELISTSSKTSKEILSELNNESEKPIELGQLRTLLFGEDFAKKGINTIVSTFYRSPNIGRRMYLAVVKDHSEDLLKYEAKRTVQRHFWDLIKQNEERENLPYTNLHIFTSIMWGRGMDPFLPYIVKNKNGMKIEGLALFKKDKYIAHIDKKETLLFTMLKNGSEKGFYGISFEKNEKKGDVLIQDIRTESHFISEDVYSKPKVTIQLKTKGEIKIAPKWLDLKKQENITFLEKSLENEINQRAEKLIAFFQDNQIDPLAIGDFLRSETRGWDIKQYKKQYPSVAIKVKTDVKILQTGVTD